MYMFHNILLAPTATHTHLTAIILVVLGCLSALATSATLFYYVWKDRKIMDISTCLLYIAIGIIYIYAAVVYGSTVAGVLSIPSMDTMVPPSYGNYLRPVLTLLLISPGLIAIRSRRH